MFQTTLAGLRARRLRLVATALAVVLGVGFISGTLIFSDTAKAAIYDGIAKFGRNVDVVAQAKDASATAGKTQNAALLEQLRGVEGVRFASGRMSRTLPVLGKDRKMLGSSYRPGTVAFFGDVPQLHPFDVTEGRLPAAAGEAALESATADRGDLAVGDTVTVLDARQGQHQLSVVGIVDCGGSKAVADDALVLLTRADMATIAETTGYYSLVAAAERGIDPEDLASRVRAQLPATIAVTTGGDFRFGLVNGAVGQFGVFLNVLLIFAGIALVVAVFVIYNTFTILVAQRMRETALLRCVGADRRQIFTSVVTESIIIGLLGSGLGYLLGIGVAAGLGLLFDTAGLVAGHPMVLTAAPVAVSLLAGTLATSASAVIPAVHATRVSPLAALTAVGMPGAGTGRQRGLRAGIALAIAVGGTIVTIAGSQPRGTSMLPMVLVMAGGVINFLAVLVAAPLFIGPLIAAIGWLPGRLFGTPAKLAASHARRTPGRAAATTAALMVGVGLMSAASVTTATVRTTADGQITANYPVDYVVESAITRTAASEKHLTAGLPIELAQRLAEDRRFSVVARVRIESTTLLAEGDRPAREDVPVAAFEPGGLAKLPDIELRSGSVERLTSGTAIVNASGQAFLGRAIGDQITVTTKSGDRHSFTIVGLSDGYLGGGQALVNWSDFAKLSTKQTDDMILVRAADDVAPKASRAALLASVGDYPMAEFYSVAEVRSQITSVVDLLIAIVAGLLGFAIIIALIGIMNTMSLSVLERTRESATVRALGLTRGQLRMALVTEALLMALAGALIGSGLGLLYGWMATRVMFAGISVIITIPSGQILLYVGLAAIAGMIAAVIPARKATRGSIVAAMAD